VLRPVLILAGAAVLASCGSSAKHTVTLPAYGDHPATTVAAAAADPNACRTDAVAFGDAARDFLAHSGRQAAYPADLWLVLLRDSLADFEARGCDRSTLGAALRRRLTPAQRQALVSGLPGSMAAAVSRALRVP
jgi:hypothetical protein